MFSLFKLFDQTLARGLNAQYRGSWGEGAGGPVRVKFGPQLCTPGGHLLSPFGFSYRGEGARGGGGQGGSGVPGACIPSHLEVEGVAGGTQKAHACVCVDPGDRFCFRVILAFYRISYIIVIAAFQS